MDIELKILLKDWVEPDNAAYYLACVLGIMNYEDQYHNYHRKIKGVFASRNIVGTALNKILEQMAEAQILEKNDDWQYRWNTHFKGYWEGGEDGLY